MNYVYRVSNSFKTLAIAATLIAASISSAAYAGGHKAAAPAEPGDVVAVAISAGSFNTLVAAIQAADLVGALQGEGPFTVFAPTDAAFAALPDGTVESLLLPENLATLQAILLYHVVPGVVMSGDLDGTISAETLQGENITVVENMGAVTVNGAAVVTADVLASNGVIHVIDAVLLPPED